jgi:predicted AlkP superfamily pyrophosphatase or phosphodiesterase
LFFGHDLPAAVANLALMLPSVPKSFGRLSEANLSAFLALQGKTNPLGLPLRKSYAVILIDGLGVFNIRSAGAHAGFLSNKLASSKSLFSGFPTTTASSLASLATGKENGSHAFLGYRVFDKQRGKAINLLNDLGLEFAPREYQDQETISELAAEAGINVLTVGPSEYSDSGFTKATMPKSKYLAAKTIEERFAITRRELAKPGNLIYLYVPELDQLAHRFGVASNKWLETIEDLDSIVSKFASSIPKGAGAILTADHGVIDVPKSSHIYLDEFESLKEILMIGGDPRAGFLYLDADSDLIEKRSVISEELAGLVDVVTVEELVAAGWLGPLSVTAERIAPDLVLLPKSDRVIYHRDFAKPKSLEMIGQHGGMSKAEWEIPLLVF